MDLVVNGEKRAFEDIDTLDRLVDRLGIAADTQGVAVAVNDTVIPRGRWAATSLHADDRVEVIHAVQGG